MRDLFYSLAVTGLVLIHAYAIRAFIVSENMALTVTALAFVCITLMICLGYYEMPNRNRSHELRLKQAELENSGVVVADEQ